MTYDGLWWVSVLSMVWIVVWMVRFIGGGFIRAYRDGDYVKAALFLTPVVGLAIIVLTHQ